MADNEGSVSANIAAQNTFTDWLELLETGAQSFSLDISSIGTGNTVTVQRKRPGDADAAARDVGSYTTAAQRNGNVVGPWLVRAGVKTGDYGSGTVSVELGR